MERARCKRAGQQTAPPPPHRHCAMESAGQRQSRGAAGGTRRSKMDSVFLIDFKSTEATGLIRPCAAGSAHLLIHRSLHIQAPGLVGGRHGHWPDPRAHAAVCTWSRVVAWAGQGRGWRASNGPSLFPGSTLISPSAAPFWGFYLPDASHQPLPANPSHKPGPNPGPSPPA